MVSDYDSFADEKQDDEALWSFWMPGGACRRAWFTCGFEKGRTI
jgi:hypothetical protein